MKLVDANVLLYAVNESAPKHVPARAWLERALSGGAAVGFAWLVVVAFVRLSTREGFFPSPLPVDAAFDQVDAWFRQAPAVLVEPTADHVRVWREMMRAVGSGGNLVNDAHLAALAIEHRCEVVSYDNDFSRFPGVSWEIPPPIG